VSFCVLACHCDAQKGPQGLCRRPKRCAILDGQVAKVGGKDLVCKILGGLLESVVWVVHDVVQSKRLLRPSLTDPQAPNWASAEQAFEDGISCPKRASCARMYWGQTREKKVRWHLAQMPTAVLGFLVVSLVVVVAVAGATVIQRRVPVEVRKTHTTGLGQIQGALGVMFGVIVGFSAFLVLNKYHAAQQSVQSEAVDVVEIYRLAEPLPEAKQEPVQRLDESYARVVIEKEWPLMRQGSRSRVLGSSALLAAFATIGARAPVGSV
jgi:hypothetical protein